MGLDTSHDAWHGAYSAFNRWRTEVCKVAGLPPLELMQGFYRAIPGTDYQDPIYWARKGMGSEDAFSELQQSLPIKWESLKPSPLHVLLHHSDCDGEIEWKDCGLIADELEKLLPLMPQGDGGGHIGNWRDKTSQFVSGLRAAHKSQENLIFH